MAVPQNYTLGRGMVYFAPFRPGTTTPSLERYFGNTPELSVTVDVENLDHYSSDRGIREKDDSVALQADRSGAMTTDSIRPENIAVFFFGTTEVVAATAVASQVQNDVGPFAGMAIQLGTSALNPSGVRNLSAAPTMVTVPPTPALVSGIDYTVDLKRGRILFEDTDNVKLLTSVATTYSTIASSRNRIVSGSKAIEGSLRYVADNPKGDNFDYFMPWVKITPNGDFQLKSDEWQTIPFNLEILKKPGTEAIYCDGLPFATP